MAANYPSASTYGAVEDARVVSPSQPPTQADLRSIPPYRTPSYCLSNQGFVLRHKFHTCPPASRTPAHPQHDRTALLKGTIRLTNETNELAAGIGENLRGQRTSLEDGSTRIREMKGFAGEARRLLNQMARRAACHRVTLWGIIVFLLVCIGLTLWRLFTNRGHII
jgi:hypothetical protein